MKIIKFIFFLFIFINLSAQSPQSMTFQSIVRDAQNVLISNNSVGIQITIIQGSPTGPHVYMETHQSNTNANGLCTIEIGTGNILSGQFDNIDWGNGPYYLRTEIDPDGGTLYTIQGTNKLLSVPYSLYSKNSESAVNVVNDQVNDADHDPSNELQNWSNLPGIPLGFADGIDNVDDWDHDPSNELQAISLTNDTLLLSNGGFVYLGSYAIDSINDADHDPNNELQALSLTNDTLLLSNGGFVYLGSYAIDSINDADHDPNNELQAISLTNDTLLLSNGGFVYLGSYAIDSINDADHDPSNELQDWSNLPGIPSGFMDGIDNVDDADNDPNNEIELPTNANVGDIMEFNGNTWVPVPLPSPSGPGTVMYIYKGQTCPSGWNTHQINVNIFGGADVDACWTDNPCTVMYIYDGQTCPTGWTHQSIGVAIMNGSTLPVDACFKCY